MRKFDPAELDEMTSQGDAAWVFDIMRETMVWGNAAALQLWSAATLAELLGRDYAADMSSSTRTRLRNYLARFERGETIVDQWTYYPRGAPVTVRVSCSGIELADGRTAMLCRCEPTRQGELTEDGLRGVEALRHTTVMISLLSADGSVVLMENPAAVEAYDFAHRPEEQAFLERFADVAEGKQALLALESAGTFSGEVRVSTRNGEAWHGVDARKTVDPVTGQAALLLNEKNITQAKEAERKLLVTQADLEARVAHRTAELQLRARMASVGTLAMGVAHELNNPLAYVRASIEVMQRDLTELAEIDGVDTTALREAAADCISGTSRMAEVLEDLATFARPSEREAESLCVESALSVAMRLVENEVKHRAEVRLECIGGPRVMASSQRLGQVFLNLLLNAAHAIEPGSKQDNTIAIACRAEGDRVVIEVEDSGSGMTDEAKQHAFDPFFTTKPVGEGMGLGLYLCQRIVHELEGTIAICGREPRGTRVRVVLPALITTSAKALPATFAATEDTAATVLIIDDEKILLRALKRLLRQHDTSTTESAREALEWLRAGTRYDVILCDLMMPDMTGMEFFETVTAELPEVAERVMFLTGGAFSQEARAFTDRHVERCFQKPLKEETLRAVIARCKRASGTTKG